MMLGMLLVWTLLIVSIVLLVRFLWARPGGGQPDARHILQERFARGEIDREEYQERLSTRQRR